MANFVIKKDGAKEEFDFHKVKESISAAAEEADISDERKKEVVDQVSATVIQMAGERKEIETTQIRDKIVKELDKIEPSAAEAWREYEDSEK